MAIKLTSIVEHDYVELRQPLGGWDPGTRGTVVIAGEDAAVVEISGDDGKAQALIDAPYDALTVIR